MIITGKLQIQCDRQQREYTNKVICVVMVITGDLASAAALPELITVTGVTFDKQDVP